MKGAGGPWTLLVDNTLVYVDGPTDDPFYATYSPLGYREARDRRNQVDESNYSTLRYDGKGWFARAVAEAQYYNLLIDEHNPVGAYKGYLNWVNRDDINTGADFGIGVSKDFDFVAGWRLGQQTQARTYYSPGDSNNTYNRALFGFEGRPVSWLKLSLAAGPDWRRYGDGANSGVTGGRHTWFFTESSLAATLSPSDTFTFSNKVWHWVSASGVSSYQEATSTWNYRHAFTASLSGSVGLVVQGVRYDTPNVRNDWATSFPIDLTYAFTRSVSLSLDGVGNRGRSKIPVAVDPGRDWDQRQIFLTLESRINLTISGEKKAAAKRLDWIGRAFDGVRDDADLDRVAGQPGDSSKARLAHEPGADISDRVAAEAELVRDLLRTQPLGDQAQDAFLAVG